MRKIVACLLAFAPVPALASGSEVLLSLWSQLALLAVVVLSLFIARISVSSKIFVFAVYLLAMIAANWLTWSLPYRDNQTLIVSVSVVLPGVSWLIALAFARHWRVANITSRSRHDAAKAARP